MTLVQKIGLQIIFAIAKRLVSRGLFEKLVTFVIQAASVMSAPGTGAEKKAWVLDRLADDAGWVIREVQAMPSWMISMVVDVVVANLKLTGSLK
jgi:hypothetical protein